MSFDELTIVFGVAMLTIGAIVIEFMLIPMMGERLKEEEDESKDKVHEDVL